MARRTGRWVKTLTKDEKAAIAARCDRFIEETFKPRFLPEVRPTAFNYPVDIFGRWRGNKYSFITRLRSGFPDNLGEEFDEVFTRLDRVEDCVDENRFDVMWLRHTGRWFRLYESVTLDEGLRLLLKDGRLHPLV